MPIARVYPPDRELDKYHVRRIITLMSCNFPTYSLSAAPANATATHKNMTTADLIAEKKKEWEKARSDAESLIDEIAESDDKELDELLGDLGEIEGGRGKERDEL
ncbi:unnamed protein product [Cercospora beticola]|nr:unnamed protein product [Cercospora beticola]